MITILSPPRGKRVATDAHECIIGNIVCVNPDESDQSNP